MSMRDFLIRLKDVAGVLIILLIGLGLVKLIGDVTANSQHTEASGTAAEGQSKIQSKAAVLPSPIESKAATCKAAVGESQAASKKFVKPSDTPSKEAVQPSETTSRSAVQPSETAVITCYRNTEGENCGTTTMCAVGGSSSADLVDQVMAARDATGFNQQQLNYMGGVIRQVMATADQRIGERFKQYTTLIFSQGESMLRAAIGDVTRGQAQQATKPPPQVKSPTLWQRIKGFVAKIVKGVVNIVVGVVRSVWDICGAPLLLTYKKWLVNIDLKVVLKLAPVELAQKYSPETYLHNFLQEHCANLSRQGAIGPLGRS